MQQSPLPLSYSEFLQMAVSFEDCRKKWLLTDEELLSCKEGLAKAETERGALEVKLKHARNQVDVEIRRRQKAEAVYEKLVGAILHLQLFSGNKEKRKKTSILSSNNASDHCA